MSVTAYDPRSSFSVTIQDRQLVRDNSRYVLGLLKHWKNLAGELTDLLSNKMPTERATVHEHELFIVAQVHVAVRSMITSVRQGCAKNLNACSILQCTHIDPKLRDAALKVFLASYPVGACDALELAYGDTWTFDLLLRHRAPVCYPRSTMKVIENNDDTTLRKLIEHGLNPFERYSGIPAGQPNTPFAIAHQSGKMECAGLILSPILDYAITQIEQRFPTMSRDVVELVACYCTPEGLEDFQLIKNVALPYYRTKVTPMDVDSPPAAAAAAAVLKT